MSSPFPQSRGGDRVHPHQPDSSSEDPNARWPAWRGYAVALLATAAATLGTEATWPLLQPTIFLLYFAAVALAAWFGGRGPAITVIALTSFIVLYRYYEPYNSLSLDDPGAMVRLGGFVGVAWLITSLSHRLRLERRELATALSVSEEQSTLLAEQAQEMEEQATELEMQMELTQELNVDLERASEAERDARELAERASRAKSEFLAVMSHELRTPLNAIIGYGELLSGEVGGALAPQQRGYVEHTSRAAWHLLELIEQILSLSRIEAGQVVLHLEDAELGAIVRDGVELARPLAERKGLQCDVVLPDEPVRLRTDAGKVRQILLNLLGNAAKFTESGRIVVEVRQDTTVAFVRVSDTGIGIADQDLERVFEPFVQVEGGSTRERGGTGLGLPVSRRLAELLGGGLVAESRVGAGSTFTLTLPIDPAGTP